MSKGRVVLHRFNGDEIFAIGAAKLMCVEVDDAVDHWFEFETLPDAIQTVADSSGLGAHPSAQAVVTLKDVNLDSLVGQTFYIPFGLTDERWEASIYYFEHENLDNNEICVAERRGDEFYVRWTATTMDVSHYDGSKPDTRVEIEGWFSLWKERGAPSEVGPDDGVGAPAVYTHARQPNDFHLKPKDPCRRDSG